MAITITLDLEDNRASADQEPRFVAMTERFLAFARANDVTATVFGTAWAIDEIAAAGFAYSFSVLPAANPLHGWPGAPRTPFRRPNGLAELPGAGRALVPFLGGIYLRYVPEPLTRRLLARLDGDALAWSYVHPYDLDPDEPFFVMPHAGWHTNRVVHTRRGATLRRLERLIEAVGGAAQSLVERLAEARMVSPLSDAVPA